MLRDDPGRGCRVTTKSRTSPRSWSDRRLSPDHRLGLRLTLAALAAFLVLVPFAGLLALVETKWGPLKRLDEDSTRSLNHYVLDHRVFVHPLQAASYVFHAWVFRLIIIALAVWLFQRGRGGWPCGRWSPCSSAGCSACFSRSS
jgi:hypothetical protein